MAKRPPKRLDDALRYYIEQSGLSHMELERRAGVSNSVLSRFVRHERSMTLVAASKLAEALGLRLVEDH